MKEYLPNVEYVVKVCDNRDDIEFIFDSAEQAMEFAQVAYCRIVEAEQVSYHECRGVTIKIREKEEPEKEECPEEAEEKDNEED